eukprot:UN00873
MGIAPAPRGVPQIKVTFNMDTNGTLSVEAEDTKDTSRSQRITIENRGGTRLTKEELDDIIREAEKFKAFDDEKRKTIQSKNDLENYSYQIRNTLDDSKFNFDDSEKEKLGNLCKEVIEWIDNNPNAEREEYEGKRKELDDIWKPIITKAYGQQPSAGPMPNMEQPQQYAENADHCGPRIDEVD